MDQWFVFCFSIRIAEGFCHLFRVDRRSGLLVRIRLGGLLTADRDRGALPGFFQVPKGEDPKWWNLVLKKGGPPLAGADPPVAGVAWNGM